jgi:hypothetical protein
LTGCSGAVESAAVRGTGDVGRGRCAQARSHAEAGEIMACYGTAPWWHLQRRCIAIACCYSATMQSEQQCNRATVLQPLRVAAASCCSLIAVTCRMQAKFLHARQQRSAGISSAVALSQHVATVPRCRQSNSATVQPYCTHWQCHRTWQVEVHRLASTLDAP